MKFVPVYFTGFTQLGVVLLIITLAPVVRRVHYKANSSENLNIYKIFRIFFIKI